MFKCSKLITYCVLWLVILWWFLRSAFHLDPFLSLKFCTSMHVDPSLAGLIKKNATLTMCSAFGTQHPFSFFGACAMKNCFLPCHRHDLANAQIPWRCLKVIFDIALSRKPDSAFYYIHDNSTPQFKYTNVNVKLGSFFLSMTVNRHILSCVNCC